MRIAAILEQVDHGTLALPEFQRGYVWSRDQVRTLFRSLYLRYPVGSLLTWTTPIDPEMARGGPTSSQVVTLLLDGQLRVTSLYGVVRGKPPAFFRGDGKAFDGLHFNVRTETFEFYGPVKMANDPLWIPVTEIFNSEQGLVIERVTRVAMGAGDYEQVALYVQALMQVRDILNTDLHFEDITGKSFTIDDVVDIFNRVNTGGTKLSAGDLALARLCADWPAARHEVHRILAGLKAMGFEFTQELLLRCTTAIATGQAPFSALRSVSVGEFTTALKKAELAIGYLLNLVGAYLGQDDDRVLAGRYAFAALARLVADHGGGIHDPAVEQRMLYWYVYNFLWGRYSGSTETVLQRDLDAIESNGVDGLIAELERWSRSGTPQVRPDDFDNWSTGARTYPLLYLLSRIGGARDLGNGQPLTPAAFAGQGGPQIHYIFPKKALYERGCSRADANALANLCFLTAPSSLDGNREPSDYLAEIARDRPGLLESQWIPTDPSLWSMDRYGEFLTARKRLLAEAANELLDSLRRGDRARPEHADDGSSRPSLVPRYDEGDDDGILAEIYELSERLRIAQPQRQVEIVDQKGGRIVVADLAWPEGVQTGRTEPIAFLLDPGQEAEEILGASGYRFFTTKERLVWYLEETLGQDIDGDQVVGQASAG